MAYSSLGSAIRKRIGQLEPQVIAPPPPPPPQSQDPFAALRPVGDALGAVGGAIGGALGGARNMPVVGGALQVASALGDATVGTPLGLAELGADQFLRTGLTDAAQRANAGRPFWELPKAAASLTRGALGQIASDTSADPLARAIGGIAGTGQDIGGMFAPIPGIGALGRVARFVPPAAERAIGEMKPGAGFFEPRIAPRVVAASTAKKVGLEPPRLTTNDTLAADLQASIDAMGQKKPGIADDATFRARMQESVARQRANPSADLSSRFPVGANDPGTGVYARPIAAKVAAGDVRAADEAAAAAGRISPSGDVALEPPVPQGPIAQAGMTGPLVGRAIGRGSSQLKRAGVAAEGIDAGAGDIAVSLKRQAKVHNANEAAIASAREYAKNPTPENAAVHERSLSAVTLLDGSLDYTARRIRAALRKEGLPAPTAADIAAAKSRTPLGEAVRKRMSQETTPPVTPAPAAPAAPVPAPAGIINIADIRAKNQATLDALRQRIVDSRAGGVIAPPAPPTIGTLRQRMMDSRAGEPPAPPAGGGITPPAPPTAGGGGITPPDGGGIPPAPPAPPSGLEKFLSVWNLPKALKASLDLSAPFRQGVLLSAGHPREFFGAFGPMLSSLRGEKFAAALDAQIRAVDRPGLYLAPLETARLGAREEAFMSNLANKIPGVSASNRAYVTFLNKLRADVYDNVIAGWEKGGKPVAAADRAGLADVINHFTGRGDLPGGLGGTSTAVLNGMFFSPRFAISRIQSIGDALGGLRPGASLASRQATADLAKFVGSGLAVLTLAQLAGYKVDGDPRSSGFGKIQIGPNVYDIWGGEQQIARYGAQLITGESVASSGKSAGKVTPQPRSDTLQRLVRSKLSPTAGAANDILGLVGGGGATAKDRAANAARGPLDQIIGRDFIGQPVTPVSLAGSLGTPLGLGDVAQGGVAGLPSLLGVGYQRISGPTTSAPAPGPATGGRVIDLSPTNRTGGRVINLGQPSAPSGRVIDLGGPRPSRPAPLSSGTGGTDARATIADAASASGIDPMLALATAMVESGFNPYAVGDGGQSFGLFQENVNGRGAGRSPDYDPTRQTQRFADDVRRLLASGFRGTPGQIAAAVQRPADPIGYARKVDAAYGSMR